MSLVRARMPRLWLHNTTAFRGTLSSYPVLHALPSFKCSYLTHHCRLTPKHSQKYSSIPPWRSYHARRYASTSTAPPSSTTVSQQFPSTHQPLSATSSHDARPSTNLSAPSTSSTSSTFTPTPSAPSTPPSIPLATALSAELSSLPPTPPPTPTASFLARPFITAMHDYPLHLLVALAILEVSSFSLTNQLLLAAGVQFSTTFAWSYLISVPIRRSAIVKGVIGVPLGVVVGLFFPWFKEIRLTELRKNASVEKAWLRFRGMFTSVPPPPPTPSPSTVAFATTSLPAASPAGVSTNTPAPTGKRKWWNPIRWTAFLARQADRYGLALLIGYRVAGAVIILGLYYLLEWGVPIHRLEELASYFGYSTDSRLVGTATQYAGAIVCSAALFPFTLMLAPFLARATHKVANVVFRRGKSTAAPTSTSLQQKTPPQ